MLSVVKSEVSETRDPVLKELQRRIAATKRACGQGRRCYPEDLRVRSCEWALGSGLPPCTAAKELGVSAPAFLKWMKEGPRFRAVDIVESVRQPEARENMAEVKLGDRVVIRIPVSALDSSLLSTLARV